MTNFSKRLFSIATLGLTCQLAIASSANATERAILFSFLSAEQEVQDPVPDVDSFGLGKAKLRATNEKATITIDLLVFIESRTDITRVHIHRGGFGENGPIEVNFFDTVEVGDREPDPNPIAVRRGVKRIRFRIDVDPLLASEIALYPEAFYFNVHTEAFPAGEVRGQLLGR